MTLQIKENNEEEQHSVELNDAYLEFYKKETGKKHVTKKGLAKYLQNISSHFNHIITVI
jgi:hypothetical protein